MRTRPLSTLLAAGLLILSAPRAGAERRRSLAEPPPSAEGRVPVKIGLYITNFVGVDEVEETFRIRGYLHETWKDPRLAYKPRGAADVSRVQDPAGIWLPALVVANAVNGRTTISTNVRARPDGTVDYWEDFRDELTMQFAFRAFPFDRQSLPVVVQPFLDERGTISLEPEPDETGIGTQPWALLAQWEVLDLSATPRQAALGKNGRLRMPEIEFDLVVARRYAFYLWKVFLPLLVMAMISYCALWIRENDPAPQLSVALSALLTMIAFLFAISSSLPKVPYLTYIDVFFLIDFLFAFAVLAELLVVHQAIVNGRSARAARLRRLSRVLFPLAYLLCNAAAAAAYFRP
jgi:hypothetical protein